MKNFRKLIISNFKDNLALKTCNTLGNMLFLDYTHRVSEQFSQGEYLQSCISNLKNFLKNKTILDEQFSIAMTLFIVAISPKDYSEDDSEQIVKDNKEEIIDELINFHFKNLSPKEEEDLRNLLAIMLEEGDYKDVVNLINKDPNFIKKIATDKEIDPKSINKYLHKQFNNFYRLNLKLDKDIKNLKNLSSNVITIGSIIATVSMTVAVGGAIIPVLVLPVTIGALRYLPKIGDKLGEKIYSLDKNFKIQQEKLEVLKHELANNLKQESQKVKVIQKDKQLEKSKFSEKSKTIDLSLIKEVEGIHNPHKTTTHKTHNNITTPPQKQFGKRL